MHIITIYILIILPCRYPLLKYILYNTPQIIAFLYHLFSLQNYKNQMIGIEEIMCHRSINDRRSSEK